MLRTIVAVERDGLDFRAMALNFEVPSMEFDLMAAVKAAALEYCRTEEGKETYEYNCSNFNWADFAMSVPRDICEKHGFSVVDSPVADEIVNWDEELVEYEDVYPEGEEELGGAWGLVDNVMELIDSAGQDCENMSKNTRDNIEKTFDCFWRETLWRINIFG